MTLDLSSVVLHPEPPRAAAPRHLLTPLPEPGHFLLVLDNTSLEYFTTCPRSAWHKLVLRREAHAKNAALTFGGAIHAGLEVLLKGAKFVPDGRTSEDPWDRPETKVEFASRQDRAVAQYFLDNPTPLDEYRTVTNALAVLDQYRIRSTFPDYEWEIQEDKDGLLIERAFELPLGVIEVNDKIDMPWLKPEDLWGQYGGRDTNKSVPVTAIHIAWSGRIDVIARCGTPNIVRVCDHKTGSIIEPMEYIIADQPLGYTWAARQLWPDLQVSGFCLNALKLKRPTGSGPIWEKGPRGGEPALSFFRSYFDYTDAQLLEWEQNTMDNVEEFINSLVRGRFSMKKKWCFGKFGRCPYHDVCTIPDAETRMRLLMSDLFKPVTWDPVNRA